MKIKHYRCLALLPFLAFANVWSDEIVTVKGPIDVAGMGTSLTHEHILVDFIGAEETGYHRWDRDEVVGRVLPFLLQAKSRGVDTFFEMTPMYLGRDVWLLDRLADESGLNIITNTGYYGARDNKFVPKSAWTESAEVIAQRWIDEHENGIEGTEVRPGFIKIAVDRAYNLSEMHKKIVSAAAIAHRKTGLTIVSHTGPDEPAFAQIELLKSLGVSPSAWIWTHAQQGTFEGYLKAVHEGAWVSIDNVSLRPLGNDPGKTRIDWFVDILSRLKAEGVLDHILISHDAGWYRPGEENGGNFRPYNSLFDNLIPRLKEAGFDQGDIDQLLVHNPARAFAVNRRLLEHPTCPSRRP